MNGTTMTTTMIEGFATIQAKIGNISNLSDNRIIKSLRDAESEGMLKMHQVLGTLGISLTNLGQSEIETAAICAIIALKNKAEDVLGFVNQKIAALHKKMPYSIKNVTVIMAEDEPECTGKTVVKVEKTPEQIAQEKAAREEASKIAREKREAEMQAAREERKQQIAEKMKTNIVVIESIEDVKKVTDETFVIDFGSSGSIEQNTGRGKRKNMRSYALHYYVFVFLAPETKQDAIQMIERLVTEHSEFSDLRPANQVLATTF